MNPTQRKLGLLFFICQKKYSKLSELALHFNVSERTIQRELYEIETALKVPLYTQRGRYAGGVYILDTYDFRIPYLNKDEMDFLDTIYKNYVVSLPSDKQQLFKEIIKKFSNPK